MPLLGQQGHYPFGESWYASGTTSPFAFTTYQRDTSAGLDYAINRSYSYRIGRFQTGDLLNLTVVSSRSRISHRPFSATQRIPADTNLYSYIVNDPANRTDPLGLDHFLPPPFGICMPFPFNIDVFLDGVLIPQEFLCPQFFDPTDFFIFDLRLRFIRCIDNTECCCQYYDSLLRDPNPDTVTYAIGAGRICRAAGDICFATCTRQCLVDRDQDECRDLPSALERGACRIRIHGGCFSKCGVWAAPVPLPFELTLPIEFPCTL